jgi:hypothetical protein
VLLDGQHDVQADAVHETEGGHPGAGEEMNLKSVAAWAELLVAGLLDSSWIHPPLLQCRREEQPTGGWKRS